jgi:hypothetical protein
MALGFKTGGRTKGVPNKTTRARAEAAALAGITPLEHMLSVLRDPNAQPARKDEMARAAAPYVHPRIAPVQSEPARPAFAQEDLSCLTDQELEIMSQIHTKMARARLHRELSAVECDGSSAARHSNLQGSQG